MDLLINIFIIFLVSIIHASLQLTPGCAILLHQKSLSSKHARAKSRTLARSFVLGVLTITILVTTSFCYLLSLVFQNQLPAQVLMIEVGIAVFLSIVILLAYYRRGKGTRLWIPRSVASFLESRAKRTNNTAESFSLGIMSVLGEWPITLTLIAIASSQIIELHGSWQVLLISTYALITAIPPIAISILLNYRSSLSSIQKWREDNKTFFRIALFASLIILGTYTLTYRVLPMVGVL
jgi:hypothetical protein